MRRRKRTPTGFSDELDNLSSPADESVLDRLALQKAMDTLPDTQREVLRLRYYGDLAYDEMAQVLDVPKGTIMSRLHLARKSLALAITTREPS